MTFSIATTQNSETVTIKVAEIIDDDLCIESGKAQIVYDLIALAFKQSKKVVVSFKDIEETVPASMDAMIGTLYENFSEEQIESSLKVVDANADIVDDINNAIYWTKRYLEDPQRFREAAQEFLGDDDE